MAKHIEYQGNFSGSQIDALLAKIQYSQVFTTEEKTKLASLVNYDDTEVKEEISKNGTPVGCIFPFAGTNLPVGYLLCNGASYWEEV